jgi:hypothetical protein
MRIPYLRILLTSSALYRLTALKKGAGVTQPRRMDGRCSQSNTGAGGPEPTSPEVASADWYSVGVVKTRNINFSEGVVVADDYGIARTAGRRQANRNVSNRLPSRGISSAVSGGVNCWNALMYNRV